MKVDYYDLITVMGLVGLAVGMWLVHPALAFITVGISLMAFGLFGAALKARTGGRKNDRNIK